MSWTVYGKEHEGLEGGERAWNDWVCFEKGQSLSGGGGGDKQISIEIYLLPVEITIFFLCFSFMFLFSDLVILALTIIVGLIFFSLKGSKF